MVYSNKDFKSSQMVKWCPGCGDHAILNSLQKALAEIGIPPYQVAIVSGIGCSSRLPYYTSAYGFHSIHGRGAAIATGIKTANPALHVWQITGDGDCLAIGGNHFIHSLRRNVDINVLLFNNRIYGLTKGQYSPTSPKGFVCKSAPAGTVESPFNVAALLMGAGGTFFARTLDVDLETSRAVMVAADGHCGTAVIECLVNCVIFNNGTHAVLGNKEERADRMIVLRHGEPMIFGKNRDKGLLLDGWNIKAVTIGEDGITEADLLVHDATETDCTLHLKLAAMQGALPVAVGVIRAVPSESYDRAIAEQIDCARKSAKIKSFDDLTASLEQWDI
ncbi:MAG: 2-oxoacid:ferredoxin oxidoreductase subunit beta [Prevotellaceae bacterium]|jgi:2-oxoglutarate ferredoxin oxidoreductase subunit beta|nr:2-oxoacid:ferredoxin oxidoreductase subunit beta [Prevotellaceae bacterium]